MKIGKLAVLVAVNGLDTRHRARLAEALEGHDITYFDMLATEGERGSALACAEVIFGNLPPVLLAAALRLRWLQLDSAGVNAYLDLNVGRLTPVALTNLANFYDEPVAESILAGILAHMRRLPALLAAQREHRWVKAEIESTFGLLHRSRVVILGAGGIALRLAALLAPFQCEVRFYARQSARAQLLTLADLDAAMPATDILVNTLPETRATVGLLNADRLARLAPAALLVNAGRGSALDETALLVALNTGRLGGAVLDVTLHEPLPAEHPLWAHPKVILTQHSGGRFPGETAAKVERFLENFARFRQTAPLHGLVDLARGY